jgi:Ca2+/Na+ antiporter
VRESIGRWYFVAFVTWVFAVYFWAGVLFCELGFLVCIFFGKKSGEKKEKAVENYQRKDYTTYSRKES